MWSWSGWGVPGGRAWTWAGWLVLAGLCTSPLAQTLPPVVARQLSTHVWFVEGQTALGSADNANFISNAAFVVTPAGVVVVDALGSPALAASLLQTIRGITPLPVTDVVVTHYHADHIYGLQVFRQAGARILAHRAALEYLHSDAAQQRLDVSRAQIAPWIDAQTRLVHADEWLDGPRVLERGGLRLELRPVGPSHTPEDLVVFVPADRVLVAGDLVFRRRIPFVGNADSRRWIEALDTLLQLDAQVVVPGHGPVPADAGADMRFTRDYLLHLRAAMGPAARNLEPFEDAYQRADWSAYAHLPMFGAAHRMNAYNTYLLMERESP